MRTSISFLSISSGSKALFYRWSRKATSLPMESVHSNCDYAGDIAAVPIVSRAEFNSQCQRKVFRFPSSRTYSTRGTRLSQPTLTAPFKSRCCFWTQTNRQRSSSSQRKYLRYDGGGVSICQTSFSSLVGQPVKKPSIGRWFSVRSYLIHKDTVILTSDPSHTS